MTQQIILPHEPVPSAVAVPQLTGKNYRDDRRMVNVYQTKAGQWLALEDTALLNMTKHITFSDVAEHLNKHVIVVEGIGR